METQILEAAKAMGRMGFAEGAALPPQIQPDLLAAAKSVGVNVDSMIQAYSQGWFDAASERLAESRTGVVSVTTESWSTHKI